MDQSCFSNTYESQFPIHVQFDSTLVWQKGSEYVGHSWGGHSQTYSFVLLGAPEREPATDGYLGTCLFRGQEAANMAPPKMSSREPPQAMKMAVPNSNLQQTK